jgi:hypothetical protein
MVDRATLPGALRHPVCLTLSHGERVGRDPLHAKVGLVRLGAVAAVDEAATMPPIS